MAQNGSGKSHELPANNNRPTCHQHQRRGPMPTYSRLPIGLAPQHNAARGFLNYRLDCLEQEPALLQELLVACSELYLKFVQPANAPRMAPMHLVRWVVHRQIAVGARDQQTLAPGTGPGAGIWVHFGRFMPKQGGGYHRPLVVKMTGGGRAFWRDNRQGPEARWQEFNDYRIKSVLHRVRAWVRVQQQGAPADGMGMGMAVPGPVPSAVVGTGLGPEDDGWTDVGDVARMLAAMAMPAQ